MISATDISCLIIPDGCIGLPTLAALEQGISVIAVRENRNLMQNDLTQLPWSEGQLHIVDNLYQIETIMVALRKIVIKEGLDFDRVIDLPVRDGN